MKAWALGWLLAAPLAAQVVPDALTRAVLEEISAREAIAHARALAGYHRLPASQGFRDAAGYVMERATALGLRGVRLEQFPWDEPAWEPLEGEIDVIEPERARLASVSGNPLIAMTGSRGGEVTALAVDAGEGDDFSTLEVRNRIVLTRKVPSGEQWRRLAGRGAAALLCAESPAFFGRQTPRESVSWLTAPPGALAMAVSPAQASRLADWLRAGKPVRLRLRLKVRETRPGRLMQVTGEIPGTVSGRDVVLVAHLDHPRPSANDNASGSGALLECLRALQALAAKGTVPSPRRSIRFWWSTEILSEQRYFERYPEQAKRILLAVNLDQAGGDRHAENHFIVIGGPEWLPTWADDLIHALVEDVAARYAPAEYAPHALTLAEGGSAQPLRPLFWPYAELSDHVAFAAPQVRVPAISLAVPSLHVIHTDFDTADRLDPTWIKRSAALALTAALFAANAGAEETRALREVVFRRAAARLAQAPEPSRQLQRELERLESLKALDPDLAVTEHSERLKRIAAALAAP
jgi:hypothetical protein